MTTSTKIFKNTFAPDCDNTEFTVSEIIGAMKFGFLSHEDLPQEIQKAVDEQLEKMKQSRETK
jgi:hypothetical protein